MDYHKLFFWLLRILIALNLSVLLGSLLYVVKLFRSNLKHYRYYKYVAIVDSRVLFKILFNYQTELYKYFLLGLILLFEISFTVIIGLLLFIGTEVKYSNDDWKVQFNDAFYNCTNNVFEPHFLTYLMFTYPALLIGVTPILVLIILFFQLFSFLCTYLKRRYYGYSLDNRVVSKYVVWWCIQAVLLFLCAIPYTQILLAVICPILLLINWIILVKENRRLSRAIRSVLYEILHFEYDDVRYRASYASYKTYRMFIRLQLIALLCIVLCALTTSCSCIIEYFVFYNCESYRIINNINIPHNALRTLHFISKIFSDYLLLIFTMLYQIFTMAPLLLQAFIYLLRYIAKEINILKYDRNLSQPLK